MSQSDSKLVTTGLLTQSVAEPVGQQLTVV